MSLRSLREPRKIAKVIDVFFPLILALSQCLTSVKLILFFSLKMLASLSNWLHFILFRYTITTKLVEVNLALPAILR